MIEKRDKRLPGRPPSVNIDLELYGYVRGELAKGRPLSEIAVSGFAVYSPDARGKLVVVREIRGQHLEAMYRAIEERNRPPFAKRVDGHRHGPVAFSFGMSSLRAIGTVPPDRRAGRPRNIRSR